MISIIGPKEVRHHLDLLQGRAEHNSTDWYTELMLQWLDQRFPPGNQYRHLVTDVLDTARSYTRHSYHHASGLPFRFLVEAIDRLRQAMYDDPNALHIRFPSEQEDLAEAIREAGLVNWHDPAEFTVVFSNGAPGTTGYDLSARMIAHKDGRAVLEVEVARLVHWAAWPTEMVKL